MKEETYKHISLVKDIISSLVLISLGILGYLVSSDVRTIQKEADQRARAKQAQELWNDIYTVTQTSAEKSNALGSAIEKLITTIDELLNNYKRVYKTDTKDIVKDDPRYNAFLTSFTGECSNVLTKIDAIVNEFDFLCLKYAVLAQEHRLEAWGKFFNQSEQVRAWKERISTNTKTVCSRLSNSNREILGVKE